MEKVTKVERQQSTDLSIFQEKNKTKREKGNERKKEKDSSPDSEPKLGEVSVSV